jgi:hypothetical protein
VRKFLIAFTTIIVNIISAIVVGSMATTSVVYAQNTTIHGADYNNTNNMTTTAIKKLDVSIIINAINAKIRSIYDGNGEKSTIDYEHIR